MLQNLLSAAVVTGASRVNSAFSESFSAFHQELHCKGTNDRQTKEYNNFENYNMTPLNMYNRLSQVYCIISEVKIHHKGLISINYQQDII